MCVRHSLDFDSRWGLPYASAAVVILIAAAWVCRVRTCAVDFGSRSGLPCSCAVEFIVAAVVYVATHVFR